MTRNSHDSSNAGTSRSAGLFVYQITIAHQIGSASAAPIDNKLSITLVSDNNVDNGRWCISSLINQQQWYWLLGVCNLVLHIIIWRVGEVFISVSTYIMIATFINLYIYYFELWLKVAGVLNFVGLKNILSRQLGKFIYTLQSSVIGLQLIYEYNLF